MTEACPVCKSPLKEVRPNPEGRDATYYSCPQCGEFVLSGSLIATLPNTLQKHKDAAAKISHALRTMQQMNKGVELHTNTVDEVLRRPLPRPREQADLLIRWIAENVAGPGKTISIEPSTHMSIVGAKSPEGLELILHHLFEIGLLTGHPSKDVAIRGKALATLSFDGWDYYEKLLQGGAGYRKAFMAMKFGDPVLDRVLESVFKPSAKQAGFDLYRLDDQPRAGLIDDRLRVEIQASDFLIADLTHDNLGAYWEAGYAEGLGKPVIYTCEKHKFEEQKTHFDTNHHLTIIWNKDSSEEAGERLKATIRATLPQFAKQED